MIEVGGQPGDRRVAVIAVVTARDMRWMLTNSNGTVVARGAGANDLGMVHVIGGYPGIRIVAVFAYIGRLYMRRVFAGCIGAVMAARTIARDVDVIEVRWQPSDGRVAVIAIGAAGDVRWVLAGCYDAIVTGAAGANDLGVVH